MTRKNIYNFLIVLILLGFSGASYSQINRKAIRKNNKRMSNFKGKKNTFTKEKKYNSIALTLNSFNYFGDLSPKASATSTDIGLTRPAIGIEFGHRFGPRYTLRAAFTYGGLRGDDFDSADPTDSNAKYRYVRNLQFRNRIKDLTIVAVFDLFKNEASYISRVQWTPYAFLGITAFHHNPQAFVAEDSGLPEAGTWVDLQPLGTEGQYSQLNESDANYGIKPYKLVQIAIPFGIGVRYRLNQVFDIGLEFGVRYTFTDYLDDVSQNYVDPALLGSDLARNLADRSQELNAAVSGSARDFTSINNTASDRNGDGIFDGYGDEGTSNYRGRSNNNDVYYVTTLKISYIIGATFTKAKFR
jgi:hypothetical protein